MPLQLNRCENIILQDILTIDQRDLHVLLGHSLPHEDPDLLEARLHSLGVLYSDVGLIMYQQERPANEIRQHLGLAGDYLHREVVLRGKPKPNEYRAPVSFEKALNLIACFPRNSPRPRLTEAAEWQFRNPVFVDHEMHAKYLNALQAYLNGSPLDTVATSELENHCLSELSTKMEKTWLTPKIQALRALVVADQASWNRALTELTTVHFKEAMEGEYSYLSDGFICLPALLLAKLGLERGLSCSVRSPYLPLTLLTECDLVPPVPEAPSALA